MKIFNSIGRSFTVAAMSLAFVSGCAKVSNQVDSAQLSVDVDGMVLQPEYLPTLVYVRPDAPTLENYTQFMMMPIAINDANPNIKAVSVEDLTEMQQYFENVMATELNKSGYQLVTEASKETMIIAFIITDMKIPTAATNVSMLVVPGLSTSVGEVTVEAILSDSMSNQVNAVVLEGSRGSYMFNGNPLSTTSDVKAAFDNWAVGFTNALNIAHGKK